MEYLWKKDDNAEYVNIFAKVRDDVFDEWDELLNGHLKWFNNCNQFKKNNKTSLEHFDVAYRKFVAGNTSGALTSFNYSLCFAEPDSVIESLVYANRSKCFQKMGMYGKALTDIRLASKWQHSKRVTLRLKIIRNECNQSLIFGSKIQYFTPKLSFIPDRNYSCMANVLEIRENDKFGRHIVAKCDIAAGKTIFVTNVFASTTMTNQIYCGKCNKINQNLISCPKCTNTMFCIGTCLEQTTVHRLECGSFFHLINDITVKLPIQTILIAINMFQSIDELKKFVENTIKRNGVPESVKDLKSQYSLFLKLAPVYENDCIAVAYKVYTSLMAIPQVNKLFDSERKRNFLMHLALHHQTVIPHNAFRHERFKGDWIYCHYIYDVMSLINHSCVPNVFNFSTSDEIGHCVSVRKIQKGEQIFINYLGNECTESLEHRKKILQLWGFDCNCAKCEFQSRPNLDAARDNEKYKIHVDPSFKYITKNCMKSYCKENNMDYGIRPKLKQECVNVLQQFGHLVLTPEINFVKRCFTLH